MKTRYASCHGSLDGRLHCPCPESGNKKTRADAEAYARRNGYTHTVAITDGRGHDMEPVR